MELLFKSLIIALGLATIPAFGMVPQNEEAQELPLHKQIDQLPPELKVHILSYRPKKSSPALDFWLSRIGKKVPTNVCSAEFSPNSSTVVTAPWHLPATDNRIKVWNTNTQECIHTIDHSEGKPIEGKPRRASAHFSPDGKRIATTKGKTAKVWSRGVWGNSLDLKLKHECSVSNIYSAQFSDDGMQIITISNEDVKLWDAHTGALMRSYHSDSPLKSTQLTSDKKIITLSHRGIATMYDTTATTPPQTILFPEHLKSCYTSAAHFNHNGTKAVIPMGGDKRVIVHDTLTNTIVHTLDGHIGFVKSARFSPDETRIISASFKDVKVWDTHTGKCLHTLLIDDSDYAALSSDNTYGMVMNNTGHTMQIHNLQLTSTLNSEDQFFLIYAYYCHKFGKPIDLSNPKLQESFENLHLDLQKAVRNKCTRINEPIMSRFLNNAKSLFK